MKTKAQFAEGLRRLPLLTGVVLAAAIIPWSARAEEPGFLSNLSLLDKLTRKAVAAAVDSLNLPAGESITVLSQTWHEANWFVGAKVAEELARRGHPVRVLESSKDGGAAVTQRRPSQDESGPGVMPRTAGDVPPSAEQGLADAIQGEDSQAYADSMQAYADSVAAVSFDPLWGEVVGEDEQESSQEPGEPPRRGAMRPGGPDRPAQASGTAPGDSDAGRPSLPEGLLLDIRIVEFGVQYSDVGRRLLFGPLRFTRVGGVFFHASLLDGPEGTIRRMTSADRHQVDRLSGVQRYLAEGASYPFAQPELKAPSLGRYVEPAVVVTIVGSLIYLFYANQN